MGKVSRHFGVINMRMLGFSDLKERGIKFSRQHLHRLVAAGKFPRPVKLGENTNAWPERDIEEYFNSRIAERDAAGGNKQTEAA
jgi:prophage regulatory protein